MPFPRYLLALLVLMGWLYATNETLLAASGVVKMEHCCEDDDSSSGPIECNCAQCVTLGSGLHLGSADSVDLPPPVLAVCWELQSLLAELNSTEAPVADTIEPAAPPGCIKVWQLVANTSLPVRGPSLL